MTIGPSILQSDRTEIIWTKSQDSDIKGILVMRNYYHNFYIELLKYYKTYDGAYKIIHSDSSQTGISIVLLELNNVIFNTEQELIKKVNICLQGFNKLLNNFVSTIENNESL